MNEGKICNIGIIIFTTIVQYTPHSVYFNKVYKKKRKNWKILFILKNWSMQYFTLIHWFYDYCLSTFSLKTKGITNIFYIKHFKKLKNTAIFVFILPDNCHQSSFFSTFYITSIFFISFFPNTTLYKSI